ncbi:hypothetical protein BGL34_00550 [Fructilactobacillus lindneri]|uniref:YtxH domain-containing protein n=2 Tax=Fructilactobacillus lindneri TaxID=53444 RepID=A0A0R2JPU2_9LACO|nr:YtxH domain-containing protein [Fructilactobacillus lindneri]ANZ58319.1 hypothetical protein AYR60_06030 [Fructilactobacillus lindneri]ANZ59641.1 hypothetical protein AYR59_06285 [Fructilactobacillus lindneri]KRN79151.1 hypothetical protein IV52_GL000557 [Fructilactobacillus lindneri DSM 20690 = JCM 11027]POG98575.1 hypothetical protein BGL31_01140 [Fructilactobacillus lindneri]POH03963.1 hypothetical protein BGL32_01080 [Fructilactobacillus lindneri]
MSFKKGLLLGSLLGGAAAYAAYRSLDEERQYRLRNTILDAAEDAKDRAVDYAFYAADTLADAKDMVNDKVDDYKGSISGTSEKITDKMNDLKDDLSQLQTYLNLVPVPKNHLDDEEKETETDDITVDMDDAFAPENDSDDTIYPLHDEHRK